MSAHGTRLRIRLFIEGIEVPVISAQVQSAPNSPGVASIQIPPLAEATRFFPRSIVHLFFLDDFLVGTPYITETGSNAETLNKQNPNVQEKNQQTIANDFKGKNFEEFKQTDGYRTFIEDQQNAAYKVLFMGEIVGFSWTKNVNSRAVVLQCEDFSNYWDYAYQFGSQWGGAGNKAIFSGQATTIHTDFLSSKSEDIARVLLSGKSTTFPKLTGLAAGIIKIVEQVGGTYFPPPGSGGKRIAGQNKFFSIAELRLKITHMVAAIQDDKTSQALLARAGYGGMFTRALGGLGGQTSIRQVMNALTKIIFHEMYPQPCPLFIPGSHGDVQGLKQTKLKDHPKYGVFVTAAKKAINSVNAVRFRLANLSNDPAVGVFTDEAVIVKEQVAKLQIVETDLKQQTVGTGNKESLSQVKKVFTTAATAIGKAKTRTARFRADAPQHISNVIFRTLDGVVEALEPLLDLSIREREGKEASPGRVVQQVFRPDIWFSAPPRCNVLFPENYFNLQYRRSFLQEPTRFLLKTNDEFYGEDFLFDSYFFAPQAGGKTKDDHGRVRDMTKGDLLDHELFTGILPVFEKMGEFNIFASRARGANAGKVLKIGPAQRSANFLYFKHRFNSRQMQVVGKFNPYIAVGCPGLVIESPVDADTIANYNNIKFKLEKKTIQDDENRKGHEVAVGEQGVTPQALSEMMGTNFLGNFTQVTHMVTQSGAEGRTTIAMQFARQSEESIEFLGAIPEAQRVSKKSEEAATRSTSVAAFTTPRLFGLGPNLGRITNVEDVTAVWRPKGGLSNPNSRISKLVLFDPADPSERRTSPLRVPVGVELDATDVSEAVGEVIEEITGRRDRAIEFRAFRITEEIPRYRRINTLIPAEEFIRPGWYGDVWSSARIGKVYGELFGTGAITDEQTITGPQGEETGQQGEEQHEAADEGEQAESADDPRGTAPALLSLERGATIQDAVEFLQLSYSYIRQSGLSTDEFVSAYTWRPIATLIDIFGTTDLTYNEEGNRAVQGLEGFHSRAFGPYENLHGLADPSIETILGVKKGSGEAKAFDTRLRKYQAVQKYMSALLFSRAMLG